MNRVPHDRIIGIDVSRDWLDIHCLPDGRRLRLPNAPEGHARLVDLAQAAGQRMPELGQIAGEQAAALTGLAPIARDSGAMRGRRAIGGARRLVRHVMFQAALVASHHNPTPKRFADRLRAAEKPHKVIIIAVARKLVTIANALCRSRQNGPLRLPDKYSC